MLRFRSLGSGSSGNATVVEARSGSHVTRLLVDCGLGIRVLERRLAQAGLSSSDIDAIFITHEHSDHVGCARTLALRGNIPIWMSQGTWLAQGAVEFGDLLHIAAHDQPIDCGNLSLRPFAVPHDAREPLQLTCSDGASRMAILTDLGHATAHVLEQLANCQALLLECNHDVELLSNSAYPAFLKRRVGGLQGHLSNAQAAGILQTVQHAGLRHVVAAHLSARNNSPDLARAALADAWGRATDDIQVADATEGTDWLSA